MEIHFASLRLSASFDLPDSERILAISRPEEFLESGANALILDGHNPALAQRAAELIRGTPRTCLLPLFYTREQGVRLETLADVRIGRLEDAVPAARDILSSLAELNGAALLENADIRLLGWLYTRPSRELLPVADPLTPAIYGYPVAECFTEERTDVEKWLDNLESQRQIAAGRLVDRIRVCSRCSSSHVNYVDVCPSCGSINIARRELIHCFTCGRVGKMEDFLHENSMVCSFCGAKLRHLGCDYDHPLDSTVCDDCGAHFVEPMVLAVCYACGARNMPDELVVRNFRAYRITDKGRISARVGELEVAYGLFDRLGLVNPLYFEQFMGWMTDFARRYKDEDFSVVVLHFSNMEAIADAIGSQRMSLLIDAMATRLKELLRVTDITSRSGMGTLWFLLPRTPRDRGETVHGRILDMKNLVELEDAPALEMKSELFAFPEDLGRFAEGTSVREILLEMGARVEEA